MKAILSRMTPRVQFFLILITEIILGASYLGILLIGGNVKLYVLYLILQYVYDLIHTVCIVLGIVFALRAASGKRVYYGIPHLSLLLLALYIKDVIMSFYAYGIGQGYDVADALLLALITALESTLLYTGVFIFLVGGSAYLFFLYLRPASDLPRDMWSLDTCPLLMASFFVAVCDTLPKLILTMVDQILFLVKDAFWLPTPSELCAMAADLILIPAFGVIAYMVAYLIMKHMKGMPQKTTPDTITEKSERANRKKNNQKRMRH